MNIPLIAEAPPLRINDDGVVLVGKTRVPIDTVVWAFNQGATPEEIVLRFDSLTLADVYAVIAYYLNHLQTIDAYIRERDEEAERIRAQVEATYGEEMIGIRERLLARLKSK